MRYTVTINFRKGPAFSSTVNAENVLRAEESVVANARANGFDGVIKSVKANRAEAAA